jgi:hypothetical protein
MPISKPLYLDDTAGPKMPRPKRFRQRVPYPIAELPAELKGPDHKLLLFCGDQGGWRLGFWSEDGWRDVACLKDRLEPSHFALASGMREENGRWFPTTPNGRMMFWWAGGIALAWLAMLAVGQFVYGDPWAICSPASSAFRRSAGL